MKKTWVDAINKLYGECKDEIVSLSDKDFNTFGKRLMDRAKTEKEIVMAFSILSVMEGWRMENK